jgi:hypothetical protein
LSRIEEREIQKKIDGQTPLDLADVLKDNEVRLLLEKAGDSKN